MKKKVSNPLVAQFGKEKRWVNYRMKEVGGRTTKVPYSVDGSPASSTDSLTWATYDEAKEMSDKVGIIFTPDQTLLGIDIDHCLENNKIVHEQKNIIEDFIKKANTYTEVSPSENGLHLFLKISHGLPLLANRHGSFECYTSGRYFTVTENPFGRAKEVREVTHTEAEALLKILGYPWKKEESIVHEDRDDKNRKVSIKLEDSDLIQRMFNSKNGEAIKALFEGDTSAHNNDESSADLALCSHLAFWAGKDAAQMERIWISSPLGARKKTQSRKDYRTRTILAAANNCREVYSVTQEQVDAKALMEDPELDLLFVFKNKNKVIVQNTENICRVLRKHPDFAGSIRYDDFKSNYEIKSGNSWRSIEDSDDIDIQTRISILFPCFSTVGKEMVRDAVIKVGKENQIDSAQLYMSSLVWDKKERLSQWLTNVYGAPLDDYHKAVASNFIKGMVSRIMYPGCKFDYVLVLEGAQGSKKSTSLYILGADWHVETTMSTDSKDFFMQFRGKAIVEFSEGETMSRTEVKKMKAIITTQVDRYRTPWGRVSQDFPRRCVFAMTTNQTEYLKDETGNRRWLPVSVTLSEANVEWLIENREQLFAEAYHRVVIKKENVYEFPKEETARQQNLRRIKDPNCDVIVDWYINKLAWDAKRVGITVHQAYRDAIYGGFATKPIDKYHEMQIADTFKNVLMLDRRIVSDGDFRSKRWFDPGLTAEEGVTADEILAQMDRQ